MLLLMLALGPALAAQPTKRPSDDERGRDLYERMCEACHGPRNHGDGPATEALVHEVPDLAGKVEANDDTIKLLMRGSGAMPSYEPTLDRNDARLVLRWMAKVHTDKVHKSNVGGPADDAGEEPTDEAGEEPTDEAGEEPTDDAQAPDDAKPDPDTPPEAP